MGDSLTGTLSFPSYIIHGNKSFLATGAAILREMHVVFRKRMMHGLGLYEPYEKVQCNNLRS